MMFPSFNIGAAYSPTVRMLYLAGKWAAREFRAALKRRRERSKVTEVLEAAAAKPGESFCADVAPLFKVDSDSAVGFSGVSLLTPSASAANLLLSPSASAADLLLSPSASAASLLLSPSASAANLTPSASAASLYKEDDDDYGDSSEADTTAAVIATPTLIPRLGKSVSFDDLRKKRAQLRYRWALSLPSFKTMWESPLSSDDEGESEFLTEYDYDSSATSSTLNLPLFPAIQRSKSMGALSKPPPPLKYRWALSEPALPLLESVSSLSFTDKSTFNNSSMCSNISISSNEEDFGDKVIAVPPPTAIPAVRAPIEIKQHYHQDNQLQQYASLPILKSLFVENSLPLLSAAFRRTQSLSFVMYGDFGEVRKSLDKFHSSLSTAAGPSLWKFKISHTFHPYLPHFRFLLDGLSSSEPYFIVASLPLKLAQLYLSVSNRCISQLSRFFSSSVHSSTSLIVKNSFSSRYALKPVLTNPQFPVYSRRQFLVNYNSIEVTVKLQAEDLIFSCPKQEKKKISNFPFTEDRSGTKREKEASDTFAVVAEDRSGAKREEEVPDTFAVVAEDRNGLDDAKEEWEGIVSTDDTVAAPSAELAHAEGKNVIASTKQEEREIIKAFADASTALKRQPGQYCIVKSFADSKVSNAPTVIAKKERQSVGAFGEESGAVSPTILRRQPGQYCLAKSFIESNVPRPNEKKEEEEEEIKLPVPITVAEEQSVIVNEAPRITKGKSKVSNSLDILKRQPGVQYYVFKYEKEKRVPDTPTTVAEDQKGTENEVSHAKPERRDLRKLADVLTSKVFRTKKETNEIKPAKNKKEVSQGKHEVIRVTANPTVVAKEPKASTDKRSEASQAKQDKASQAKKEPSSAASAPIVAEIFRVKPAQGESAARKAPALRGSISLHEAAILQQRRNGGGTGATGGSKDGKKKEEALAITEKQLIAIYSGLAGLRNTKSSCYLNAVLQCLCHTEKLTKYFLSGEAKKEKKLSRKDSTIIEAYSDFLKEVWAPRKNLTIMTPRRLRSALAPSIPILKYNEQEDAQEFLQYLLCCLHEEVNKPKDKVPPLYLPTNLNIKELATSAWQRSLAFDNSHLSELFMGQIKSSLTCLKCYNVSASFETFWSLSLPLPLRAPVARQAPVVMSECFRLFSAEERLIRDNRPKCGRCDTPRDSSKKLSVQRFPEILVLHLKRFTVQGDYITKLTSLVSIPTILDVKEIAADKEAANSFHYELYGVINHYGNISNGHYVADCKHDGVWFNFDDHYVRVKTNDIEAPSPYPYVLFYEKKRKNSNAQ